MVDMLLAGDRAMVRIKDDIQTWHVVRPYNGKLTELVAHRNNKISKIWFDGKNYRVGRYTVIARA